MPAKTKRHVYTSRSMTNKNHAHIIGDCIDSSYHGLHHWYKNLHEKLGWMILAKSYGMSDKIAVYKTSLHRFKCAVEKKIKNTRDHDRKEDLRILHHNIMILTEHVDKDF